MEIDDRDLTRALRRLADTTAVPPIDPRREAVLMAAFDEAAANGTVTRRPVRFPYWGMSGLATAAAVLIAIGLGEVRAGRHGIPTPSIRGVQFEPQPPNEFVLIPGAAALPPMESGSLVRMDVPVTLLPSLGVTPPVSLVAQVKADVIVGQDGIARAVRLVGQ
jgi:hypothetical protein